MTMMIMRRNIYTVSCVFCCSDIASLKGESDSERSSSHSNRLHNDSSIVVSVKTSTSKSTTTTVSPRTTTTIPPSTTVPTLPNPYRWSVPTGGNVCLLLESGIRMKFSYVKQVWSVGCLAPPKNDEVFVRLSRLRRNKTWLDIFMVIVQQK